MKNQIILLTTIIFIASCFSSQRTPPKEVRKITDINTKVSFTPNSINQKIASDFEITIQPIDAKEMNNIAQRAATFDGNYEKTESFATLISIELNRSDITKAELRAFKHKKQLLDLVQNRINSGDIPEKAGNALMKKILYEEGIDGTDDDFILGTTGNFNPYKVGSKYLSVFQVTSKNMGNKVQRIKLQDLLFNSGYEQLYPFNTSYFEKLYEDDQTKFRILLRLNMPDELVVPPGETVVKYISVPSLNPVTETLNIRLMQENNTANFNFQVQFDAQSKDTYIEKYWFVREKSASYTVLSYHFVLLTKDNNVYPIKDNTLFVSNEMARNPVSIFGVYTTIEGYVFGKREKFFLTEYPKNIIYIPFIGYQRYK